MKIFHSRYTNTFYKNRVEAVAHSAQKLFWSNVGQPPDRVRTILVNEIDIGIMKKQAIVDLLNGKPVEVYDKHPMETVAKIWLEGNKDNPIIVCREMSQVGIVYRNIEPKPFAD